jgi:hypothetical protein
VQEEHFEEEGTDRMDPSTKSGGNGLFQLPGAQQQLVDAVVATKTPVVQVLINGGPLSLKAPSGALKFALLEAFYGAQARHKYVCPFRFKFWIVTSLKLSHACFRLVAVMRRWDCRCHFRSYTTRRKDACDRVCIARSSWKHHRHGHVKRTNVPLLARRACLSVRLWAQ